MTGKFTSIDSDRCNHYARFMRGLTLPEANAVFWFLFIMVLVLMCISSIQHHKSINITDEEKGLSHREIDSKKYRRQIKTRRLHYLGIASLCFILAIVCVVLECFAAFNIEYCDGEDLIQLYWGFWSILQVGSLIAIGGVMVQFWIVLGNHETPSWAVALGTPVLVFAALGWIFRSLWKNTLQRCTGRSCDPGDEDADDESDDEKNDMGYGMSRAATLVPEPMFPESVANSRESLRRTSTF